MSYVRYRACLAAGCPALLALITVGGCHGSNGDGMKTAPQPAAGAESSRTAGVEPRIARLEALAPGQGALMSQLGYHFGNLWFALDRENWPLAGFYLHECDESLEQAVMARPVRPLADGGTVDITGIAEALDHTQFTGLEEAIRERDKPAAVQFYADAMIACNACHRTVEMPFLHVRTPTVPPSPLIAFDPAEQ